MAVTYRASIAVWGDSLASTDAMCINPCFHDTGLTSDPQSLATALCTAVVALIGASRQVRVRLYDVNGTKPIYPAGEKQLNTGLAAVSTIPREIALCLSFYATENQPRKRGRLYIPMAIAGAAPADMTVRPSSAIRSIVANWVPIFTGLGGVDVDWVVYSKKDNVSRPITDWWIDDEWDIQRSRGLRGGVRTKGTTTEGNPPNFLSIRPGGPADPSDVDVASAAA